MSNKLIFADSFIQFCRKNQSENRVCKIIAGYDTAINEGYNIINLIFRSDLVNYITIRNDGNISYLPAGKDHLTNVNGTWKREGRQDGKPGKVIRKILTDKGLKLFTDKEIENFANHYKSTFSCGKLHFELWPANKIGEVYSMDRKESGTLGGSCMNGDDYFSIYENCSKLQILVLLNKDGILHGRSLVWSVNDTTTFIDRFYVAEDHYYQLFIDYAVSNKFYYKSDYKSYHNKTALIGPEGNEVDKTMKIFTDTDHDNYPYIDTFSYGSDGFLTNSDNCCEYTYNNTDGTREGGEDDHSGEEYDEIADCYIDADDAVYIENGDREYRGRTTNVNNCVLVDHEWYYKDDSNIIEVGNTWYLKDDDNICFVSSQDEYYLIDDCTFIEDEGEYYLSEDCVYSEFHSEGILKENAVEIGEDWYKKEYVESQLQAA